MRILVDVDGVLADFVGGALEFINALLGADCVYGDVRHWEMERLLPPEMRAAFAWHVQQPGFCRRLRPLRNELHYVRELQRLGHELVVVTSPWKTCATWIPERTAWVREYLGDVELHHTHDKASVPGDVLIDDKPSHVQAWQQAHPNGSAYLFVAPYNIGELPGQPRVRSIRELLRGL